MSFAKAACALGGIALGSAGIGAYAYRERIRTALIPRVIGAHSVIANCYFDGTVSVLGPLRYCQGNTFNATGLAIRGAS